MQLTLAAKAADEFAARFRLALNRGVLAQCGLDVDALSDEQVEAIYAAYLKRNQAMHKVVCYVTGLQFRRHRKR